MKKNLGIADKTIRMLVAVIISILFFAEIFAGTFGWVLLGVATWLLITSLLEFCPLYLPFKLSTKEPEE